MAIVDRGTAVKAVQNDRLDKPTGVAADGGRADMVGMFRLRVRLLSRWAGNQRKLADRLDCHYSTVNRWVQCNRVLRAGPLVSRFDSLWAYAYDQIHKT